MKRARRLNKHRRNEPVEELPFDRIPVNPLKLPDVIRGVGFAYLVTSIFFYSAFYVGNYFVEDAESIYRSMNVYIQYILFFIPFVKSYNHITWFLERRDYLERLNRQRAAQA